jgi:hypothetical protein
MSDFYTNNPLRNMGTFTSHDPTTTQGNIYYGILKRWSGAIWMKESLKIFLQDSWQLKPLKRWNGTDWVIIDTTGV